MKLLAPTLIFLLGCLLHYQRGYYGAGLAAIHARGVDDAYITYRYGWNLAHFSALSWNESGYRRTEGFTNPLWVLVSAAWSLPGDKDWVYPLSVLTSVALSAMLLFILTRSVYRKNGDSPAALLGLIMAAAVPAVWLHATSGLESAVFGLGLALLAYLVISDQPAPIRPAWLVGLAVALGLLRSDGFIYLTILLAAALIAGSPSWKWVTLGLVISSLALFGWRYLTFGVWLPNTALAKVNFTLLERLTGGSLFILTAIFSSGLLVYLLLGLGGLRMIPRRAALAGCCLALAWLGYYIYVGGDWGFERHLFGLYFLCAAWSASLWLAARPSTRVLFAAVLVATAVVSIIRSGNRFNYLAGKASDPWILLGQAVENDREKYGVLVVRPAGKIPFYAGGDCIDALGLNDPYLATFQREIFTPGHSAGNDQAAIGLAQAHPAGVYAMFAYLDPDFIAGPEDISLWVDNRHPQDEAQQGVTAEQWQAAQQAGDPLAWSLITTPVMVAAQGP